MTLSFYKKSSIVVRLFKYSK